ncbi:MAG: tetratricopeptide repeat protein [Thermoleophilaceae bacterium]
MVVAVAFAVLAYSEGGLEPGFRAGVTIFLWLVVILGLALGRFPRAAIPRPALLAGLLLAAYAAFSGLSLFWADDSGAAFNEVIRVLVFLGLFVAVVIVSSAGGARSWLVGLAFGIGAIALIALLDRAAPDLLAAGGEQREKLPLAETDLSFPVGYWNGLGLVMAIGGLLYTWLGADARTRLGRAAATAAISVAGFALILTASRGSAAAAVLGAFVLLVFGRSRTVLVGNMLIGAAATVLTALAAAALAPDVFRRTVQDPGGEGVLFLAAPLVVAAAAGLLRFALDRPIAAYRAPRWSGAAALGAVILLALVTLAAGNPIRAVERFAEPPAAERGVDETASLAAASGSGRFQYWETGFDAFTSAPIAGIGAGGFGAWWGENHTIAQRVIFVHSLFIGALAELGIVGLALVVAFLVVVATTGIRAWRPWGRGSPDEGETADRPAGAAHLGSAPAVALAVLAAGILSATIDWMWELPAAFAPVIVVAALLTGPALAPPPQRGRSRFGFGVGALVVGWLAIVAALLSVFGEDKAGDSLEALERGKLAEAIDSADTAATLTPWSAQPYLLEAAALEGQGDLEAAQDAADEALERDSGDWAVWAVAARIQAKRGDLEAAFESLSEANRRNPEVVAAPRSAFRSFGLEPDELRRG